MPPHCTCSPFSRKDSWLIFGLVARSDLKTKEDERKQTLDDELFDLLESNKHLTNLPTDEKPGKAATRRDRIALVLALVLEQAAALLVLVV